MKRNREEMKAEFIAKAEMLFDELMEWDETTTEPTLTQIEDVVLKMRKRLGEEAAQIILEEQANKQPVPGPGCPECGKEMRNKGQKSNHVESRIGELEIERGYYYCPRCKQGHFPPGSPTSIMGETLE